ncbi:tRNA threonylcarbamoyl adenosine modification protein YeaZ [Rubrobacter radiotolerans]|uniref:tRNA (Adenosine(37)-N6)-threonylcarbamoyltransferase complex dimerization subunit type 1 TsaB n=1 Tax=Rubrobacter radiotolerans TaxID=42256 RepID=A0A023X1T7_RUBRA|nr:tRNA (adenosine(37)-N6)-threonylcarbamoyltransferase complex dimerization subunit type 1 TsaB [Rubrobacter radiotolerans]AHY45970.1 tRNA threonylcarbamoyl adenosine modification protein YeaZ [Rubrobacter radiotolerans]MDX5893383.1 tRNA (adenosine(37)-N6)-threonylcarbamoyltransferase complex dimerization subunit type 1 TsaB [Rubrobacter radiotolerans]SMC03619.1 tRNA threonylcarbamoyladenosine biosynthesis protein TsaB [Rubrobacter radiotolerans DSM 5868]
MLVLALEASTPVVSAALARVERDGDEERRDLLAEVVLAGAGTSEGLLPAVEAALSLSGREFSEVEGIVVGLGPGTFTGIRIAAATARSLAFGSDGSVALMRGSTLAALAAPALAVRREVLAVLDARRGEVFARSFLRGEGLEVAEESILCARPEELVADLASASGEPLLVGDGAVRYRDELSDLGEIPPDDSPLHRATAGGLVLSASLESVPPERVIPVYVREPDAEVRRDLNPWLRR